MIDENKLKELLTGNFEWVGLKHSKNPQLTYAGQLIEFLWKENADLRAFNALWLEQNAELKEALSGRTVSCSNCNKLEAENAELKSEVKAGAALLAKATDRINDLEAVAKAAFLWHQQNHGEMIDDCTLGQALAALREGKENQ